VRALARLAALALLVLPAAATWSIVVVDVKTGEVAVAGATCISAPNLKRTLAVIRVGHGAAAAQAVVDSTAANRIVIWNGFIAGDAPREILDALALADAQHELRQYGIVDLFHGPVTFSGSGTDEANPGVAGVIGDLRYAIQGNILAGDPVVFEAEKALLESEGDLSQRVMAAMEAARANGGDGRCSCSTSAPTACGAPPPYFRQSARTAFIVLARIGDPDGICAPLQGCANGKYWLDEWHLEQPNELDPVTVLEREYAAWRLTMVGRPDQVESRIELAAAQIPADGSSQTTIEIQLRDLEGGPVSNPAALVLSVQHLSGGVPAATPGAVQHLGGGRFAIPLTAGVLAGVDTWRVWVDDGIAPVALQPDPVLTVGP
jgi:uncharacterized Ntn-hydrolase superfamily protein